jgi:hypothetical protein
MQAATMSGMEGNGTNKNAVRVLMTHRSGSQGSALHRKAIALHANGLTWTMLFLFERRAQDEAVAPVRFVNAASAKAQCGAPRRFDGSVPTQGYQVTPRQL